MDCPVFPYSPTTHRLAADSACRAAWLIRRHHPNPKYFCFLPYPMALLTSIPGTSATNDGFLPIASIKQTAKVKSSALHGASAINLIATARKVADSGILKEDEGDLQEALLKYYTTLKCVLRRLLDCVPKLTVVITQCPQYCIRQARV